jgi:hypothetical protein
MPRHTTFMLAGFLLLLAVAPWIVSSCAVEPLIPDEVRLERQNFEATVEAEQQRFMDPQRQAPSTIEIVPLGTIATEDAPTPTSAAIIVTPTPEPLEEEEDGAEAEIIRDESEPEQPEDSASSSTVVKVQTSIAVETPLPTARLIIVRSEATQPTALPTVTASEALTATAEITAAAHRHPCRRHRGLCAAVGGWMQQPACL